MNSAETFEGERRRLFALAYRMLGSVAEAEDVVQDAWLRFAEQNESTINNPGAWLTTVTTRLAIDRLRSARHRREVYVGPWLPEPLLGADTESDPARHVELADSLSVAFLVLLERLDPVERAAFLLREVFGAEYGDVADAVERSVPATRQIVHRAKERLDPDRPVRFEAAPEDEQRLLDGFLEAAIGGDLDRFRVVLHDDAVAWSDGGANQRAARHPVVGAERIAMFFRGIARKGAAMAVPIDIDRVRVNGAPGLTIHLDGELYLTAAFDLRPDAGGDVRIAAIHSVLNPDKLGHLA